MVLHLQSSADKGSKKESQRITSRLLFRKERPVWLFKMLSASIFPTPRRCPLNFLRWAFSQPLAQKRKAQQNPSAPANDHDPKSYLQNPHHSAKETPFLATCMVVESVLSGPCSMRIIAAPGRRSEEATRKIKKKKRKKNVCRPQLMPPSWSQH